MNTLAWSTGGYADIYMTKNNDTADEVFVTRLNAHQDVNNRNVGNFAGVRVDRVATGYSTCSQIILKVRKGVLRIMGLGFTKEIDRPVAPLCSVHSDSVFGDLASLSKLA